MLFSIHTFNSRMNYRNETIDVIDDWISIVELIGILLFISYCIKSSVVYCFNVPTWKTLKFSTIKFSVVDVSSIFKQHGCCFQISSSNLSCENTFPNYQRPLCPESLRGIFWNVFSSYLVVLLSSFDNGQFDCKTPRVLIPALLMALFKKSMTIKIG